jgi:cell division protease FtsH
MDRKRPLLLLLNLAVLVSVGFLVLSLVKTVSANHVTWSQAKADISADKVEEAVFDGPVVYLTYKPGPEATSTSREPAKPTTAEVVRVEGDESFLVLLETHAVKVSARQPACDGAVGWFIPLLLMIMIVSMVFRREGGAPPGVAAFGKSHAKMAPEEGTGITFADVAGIPEAKEELEEIVSFLKTPEKFTALGGKIPKGVLLVGPPGTGKTLLARAVAGEAGVPFFSISGSDFVEMFVGVGAARVRDLFGQAGDRAPCIIFIDELDAIGRARGGVTPMGGHDEREQTLNQLLVEMDGFDGRKGIIIMAATNRPEILDRALLRAGRFDRQVLVDRPDVRGREAILQVHSRTMKLKEDVDLAAVARITPGFAGADLANVLNEAALLAARRDKKQVELVDIEEAIERSVAGLEKKSRRLSLAERKVVAYHEAGHAICAAASPGADPVQKISIIPRGIGALGYTMQMPAEDRYLMTRTELQSRLTVLYGGRAAEERVFGDFTTGASDDINKASDLARRMVMQFGMSDTIGAIDYGGERQNPFGIGGQTMRDIPVSEATARLLDEEFKRMLEAAHVRARDTLERNDALLHRMAKTLLEKEVLDRMDLAAFVAEVVDVEGNPVGEKVAALLSDPGASEIRAELKGQSS